MTAQYRFQRCSIQTTLVSLLIGGRSRTKSEKSTVPYSLDDAPHAAITASAEYRVSAAALVSVSRATIFNRLSQHLTALHSSNPTRTLVVVTGSAAATSTLLVPTELRVLHMSDRHAARARLSSSCSV